MLSTNVLFAVSCLLVTTFPAYAEQAPSGAKLTPDAFARTWTAAWNSRDVDRILSLYTEDAFYEDVPSVVNGWDKPLHGHQIREEENDT
jgi:nuclear transport factor 2 (NTF2) superfamily protein